MRRRDFLKAGSVLTAAGLVSSAAAQELPTLDAGKRSKLAKVKALTFDVFGTTCDWRSSIIREGEMWGARNNIRANWPDLADDWINGYGPVVDRMYSGEIPWGKIDDVYSIILHELRPKYGLEDLSEEEIYNFVRAWHRIAPWPDALEGIRALKKKYIVASLSDGNVSMLINIAKNAGIPWDAVLSSELSGRHYKPEKEVYLKAAELLSLRPHEILMVSAHKGDLAGASAAGFTTVLVPRPKAYVEGASLYDNLDEFSFDIMANDYIHLSRILNAI